MSEQTDILKEVYEASGKEANTIPEKKLQEKGKRKMTFLSVLLIVIAAAALIVIICLVIYMTRFIGKPLGDTATASATTMSVAEKPSLVSNKMDGTNCVITLKKGTYDIEWDKIYAKDSSGNKVAPISYDATASTVSFSLEKGTLNIYIPDSEGNESQLILQPDT